MTISTSTSTSSCTASALMSTKPYRPHIIVVGGSSGIGLALALHHQHLGWQVSVIGHSASKMASIHQQHPNIVTHICDLTDDKQTQQLLDKLSEERFDRLVYSAGSYYNERVHHLTPADSDQMLAINLQAFEQVFRWASGRLKIHNQPQDASIAGKPSLICLASIAGMLDYPYASLYAKSKRAMIATAAAYRLALAPYGIQVNCIAAGYVDTQALRELNDGDASHKPFIMTTQTAVGHIMQAIEEDVELAVFPRAMRHITRVLNHLPKPVLSWVLRSQRDKNN